MNPLSRELIAKLELKVLSVQRTVAGKWWNYRQVISPFSRLWLVLDGKAVVKHHGQKFELLPGQVYLIPSFTPHDCYCATCLDHYHLHFTAQTPTGIDLFSLIDCEYQISASPMELQLFKRIEAIYPDRKLPCYDPNREEYKRFPSLSILNASTHDAANAFEAQGALGILLAQFLKSARCQESIHARATRQFLVVQEFIHANMRGHIVLADLARLAELHPTYFSDRFKQIVGIRPLDYLLRCRIERAQFLLLTSRASVKEIASAVGIPDAAYFSRVFTRLCHVAPSVYRASHVV